jgi:hypothetical protein
MGRVEKLRLGYAGAGGTAVSGTVMEVLSRNRL